MISYKTLLLCLLTILITGCASNNIDSDYQIIPERGKALILGSITYAGLPSKYSVKYENVSTKESAWLSAGRSVLFDLGSASELSLKKTGVNGNIFAIELDPGKYTFDEWTVQSSVTLKSEVTPKIEIDLAANKALYVGNFHFVQTDSIVLVVSGADVFYSNKFHRDIEKINEAFPLVASYVSPINISGVSQVGSKKEGYFSLFWGVK